MKIIGIAGGSGAGKSTVSYCLVDAYPEKYEVVNLDDYQKLKTDPDLPMLHGMINWDHPDIILWDNLIADLEKLAHNQSVTINTWAHRSNPEYPIHRKMFSRTISPKPILIVEGYLALYNKKLRDRYDKSFYLELDENARNERRDKGTIVTDTDYEELVMKPMFNEFVEPSKRFADVVIDVSGLSVDKISSYIVAGI